MRLLGLNTGRGHDGLRMAGSGEGDGDGDFGPRGSELFRDMGSLCLDMSHLLLRVSKLSLGMHTLYLDMRELLVLSRRGEGGSDRGRGSPVVEGVERVLAMSKLLLGVGKLS